MTAPPALSNIWSELIYLLSGELSAEEIDRWIKPLRLVQISHDSGDSSVTVAAPNRFFSEWIQENYAHPIEKTLSIILSTPISISCVLSSQPFNPIQPPPEVPAQVKEPAPKPAPPPAHDPVEDTKRHEEGIYKTAGLNPAYSFNNFVVGDCNQFAHAAAVSVANMPGQAYNPLFIYGGVGLGKTHLLNSVGCHMLSNGIASRVAFVSSEEFTNQMIAAIRNKNMEAFRAKYRYMDALMIDDIHFLGAKERTQEEFFFTFNALHEAGKQIILSSDQQPRDIPGLEERLRSRFEWGLITDLQPPDRETKAAIIQDKAAKDRIELPEEVAFFLASSRETNIRVLEGYIVRLAAYSSLTGRPIDMDLVKQVLSESLHEREVSVEEIIRLTAEHYHVHLEDMISHKRVRRIAQPRQIAMYLCRRMTAAPLVKIGQMFGGKDHSTVVHAVKKVEAMIEENSSFRKEVRRLEQNIRWSK